MTFVPLHVHSQFSVLDALASVDALAKAAAEFGMPAMALTDHGNLFGAVDFYSACKEAGVKGITGCEVYIAPTSRMEKSRIYGKRNAYHSGLLVKNEEGYRNLCKLTSAGFIEGFYYVPRIDRELLKEHSEGLICLSGCMSGFLSQAILNDEDVREVIDWHRELFGEDYYLEIQRHPMTQDQIEADGYLEEGWLEQQYHDYIERQEKLNTRLVEIARTEGIKLVATNDTHYLKREDWRAHEILLNVQSGEPCEIWEVDSRGTRTHRAPNPKRRTYPSHEFYFKSSEEMAELFSDLPEAISNTLEVADKCDFAFDFGTRHYPVFVPPTFETASEDERRVASENFLREMCETRIAKRYTPDRLAKVKERYPDRDPLEVVRSRLQLELDVIIPKGMCDYLLIVWDFIDWAKRHGIPVGPGRGSGAGSIILYLIGVTDIEPLRFNLFFERFINPERVSYPDIDVDICMERRGEVIDYVVEKYGKDCVAQIITFGTMKAKMAIKDVGRVLNVPLPKVNEIAKLIPEELGITIERSLEVDPDLLSRYQSDEETKRLIDLAMRLEGSVRNTGIHAAGVIISGQPLTEHIPICTAKDSEMAVTQYSMNPVERVGMLKMDFLGLKTLTSIEKACAAIPDAVDPLTLPLDDAKTFALLNQGQTQGIFQMESGGMQDLARNLHIDRFEEIIAVVALYRPGPMSMIPSFIDRKWGREPIDYDHPEMKTILEETYGIMVYQEQVMQIAQNLAGYSLGEGDILRKAMGKKIMSQMKEQAVKFREGAVEHGLEEETAVAVFDKMERFAAYGFNKAHAACYGFLTYVTAYLKANYPGEWMAALMTCDRDDTAKVAKFIAECQAMGIAILPPDVNEAGDAFVSTQKGIRFAMSGIRGVGHGVVEAMVEEREKNGPYKSLLDFCRRIDKGRATKKPIEALILAGSFDFTDWSRDALLLALEPTYDTANSEQKDKDAGALSLFSLMDGGVDQQLEEAPKVEKPSTPEQVLFREKEMLGFFLTGHPLKAYEPMMRRLSCVPFGKVAEMDDGTVFRTAFILDEVATRISQRSGKKFAILKISDGYESCELPVWPELYEERGHMLVENQLLYAVLQADRRDGNRRLNCHWFDDLTKADDAMVTACDQAFDAAKLRVARLARHRKKEPAKKEEKKEEKRMLKVVINADETRLSHILKIKELVRGASGETPYVVELQAQGRPVGRIHVPADWGITLSPELKQKIEQIASVREVLTSTAPSP